MLGALTVVLYILNMSTGNRLPLLGLSESSSALTFTWKTGYICSSMWRRCSSEDRRKCSACFGHRFCWRKAGLLEHASSSKCFCVSLSVCVYCTLLLAPVSWESEGEADEETDRQAEKGRDKRKVLKLKMLPRSVWFNSDMCAGVCSEGRCSSEIKPADYFLSVTSHLTPWHLINRCSLFMFEPHTRLLLALSFLALSKLPSCLDIYSQGPLIPGTGCEVLGVCRRRRWGRVAQTQRGRVEPDQISQGPCVLRGLRWSSPLVRRTYFLGQVWLFSSFSSFKAWGLWLTAFATGADSTRESEGSSWQG